MSKSVSLACAIIALSVAAASLSFAQTSASPPGTVPMALTCRDFHKNQDGTWSPNRPVQIGGTALSPDVSYTKGQVFDGLPLVEALEESCDHPNK